MAIVDSYALQYEVEAEYPYSTTVCDTEAQAIERINWELRVHGVSCRVRVIGPWARHRGVEVTIK